MTISISSKGTAVKDNFRRSLEKKMAKLDRFFDQEADAKVMVSNENGRETVEITIRANNMQFRAEKTTKDRLDSLDGVVDSLFRQIVKNKKRLEKRLQKAAFDPGYDDDYVGAEEEEYHIARTKKVGLKPMDVEEAILQMNLVGHGFFMFLNADTELVNVVYRRNDGNYGLIEPGDADED